MSPLMLFVSGIGRPQLSRSSLLRSSQTCYCKTYRRSLSDLLQRSCQRDAALTTSNKVAHIQGRTSSRDTGQSLELVMGGMFRYKSYTSRLVFWYHLFQRRGIAGNDCAVTLTTTTNQYNFPTSKHSSPPSPHRSGEHARILCKVVVRFGYWQRAFPEQTQCICADPGATYYVFTPSSATPGSLP
ncbi:hypothetical protein BJV78DRAFT_1356496, partial [Lactifluus subvellereus]